MLRERKEERKKEQRYGKDGGGGTILVAQSYHLVLQQAEVLALGSLNPLLTPKTFYPQSWREGFKNVIRLVAFQSM